MVMERVEVIVKDGLMDEFLEVLVSHALPLTKKFEGLVSFQALRGVEDVNSVMFLATWESIEARHASRPKPSLAEFRRILLPYTAGAKQAVHFLPIGE